MVSAGRACSTMVSPSTQMRAMPWSAASRASSAAARASRRAPVPSAVTSRPTGVASTVSRDFAPGELGRDRAQSGKLGDDGRLQHRTFLDREQLVAAAAMVSEDDPPTLSPGGEHRAPSRARCNPAQRPDLHVEAALAQRLDDDAALPDRIERIAHVLGDAAATGGEMPALRLTALGIWRGQKLGQAGATDANALARQREGDVRGPVRRLGNSVALRAEPGDVDLLGSSCHEPPPAGTRGCRSLRQWARG